jgi:hypothetical protein
VLAVAMSIGEAGSDHRDATASSTKFGPKSANIIELIARGRIAIYEVVYDTLNDCLFVDAIEVVT